jgi:uncharacterized protein (DUF2164 family)
MKKCCAKIELIKDQKAAIATKLKENLRENFDTDIGGFKAELFIDFISENIAARYYNKGLADSIALT